MCFLLENNESEIWAPAQRYERKLIFFFAVSTLVSEEKTLKMDETALLVNESIRMPLMRLTVFQLRSPRLQLCRYRSIANIVRSK